MVTVLLYTKLANDGKEMKHLVLICDIFQTTVRVSTLRHLILTENEQIKNLRNVSKQY